MSRLFPDQLIAYLAPGEVLLCRGASDLRWRGFNRLPPRPTQVVSAHRSVCGNHSATGNALFAALAELGAPPSSKLAVIFSHAYIRFLMAPWNPDVRSREEEAAYLSILFDRSYGMAAGSWALTVDDVPPRPLRLACGIDRALLAAVHERAAMQGIRINACKPYLAFCLDTVLRPLAGNHAWVVTVEADTWCFALLLDGQVVSVRSRAAPTDWIPALPLALEREAMLVDCPDGVETVHVVTHQDIDHDAFESARWRFNVMPQPAWQQEPAAQPADEVPA